MFYNTPQAQISSPPVLLTEDLDVILAKATDGPLDFVQNLASAPWLFDERYVRHIVIGIKARLALLKQMQEWSSADTDSRNVQTFVALIEEVDTALLVDTAIDWLGCPAVPDQIIESIQKLITCMESSWVPPPATEIMKSIAQMEKLANTVRAGIEKLRKKEIVTAEDLTRIIDEYDDLKDEVHTNIDLRWEQICKAAKGENMQRLVDVISMAIEGNRIPEAKPGTASQGR